MGVFKWNATTKSLQPLSVGGAASEEENKPVAKPAPLSLESRREEREEDDDMQQVPDLQFAASQANEPLRIDVLMDACRRKRARVVAATCDSEDLVRQYAMVNHHFQIQASSPTSALAQLIN